jgi:hypothetical protein
VRTLNGPFGPYTVHLDPTRSIWTLHGPCGPYSLVLPGGHRSWLVYFYGCSRDGPRRFPASNSGYVAQLSQGPVSCMVRRRALISAGMRPPRERQATTPAPAAYNGVRTYLPARPKLPGGGLRTARELPSGPRRRSDNRRCRPCRFMGKNESVVDVTGGSS